MPDHSVLIVDDDPGIRFAFQRAMESMGLGSFVAEDGLGAVELVRRESPAAVFMDVAMPRMDGLAALKAIKEIRPELPVIIITGQSTMDTTIQAMQLGAFDYLTKPLDLERIRVLARRAVEAVDMRLQIRELQRELRTVPPAGTTIIGSSPAIQEVFKRIGSIASTPNTANVLILGETGTGKELTARVIHERGPAPKERFVAINCTVLPENLLESELFGHERGAFTGADRRKLGKFEIAGAGTVFLDEIGDVPPAIQAKLLRVVQERTFERLGGHEPIPLRARVISATHHDLKSRIESGEFREDLYYRLDMMEISIPPLRERPEDVPALVDHFVQKYSQHFGIPIRGVSEAVVERLRQYRFDGNIRELENMIGQAMAMQRGELLTLDHFPPEIREGRSDPQLDVPVPDRDYATARQMVLSEFERRYLAQRLADSRGNVSAAARRSGIERQSFQRLMKKHGLSGSEFKDADR